MDKQTYEYICDKYTDAEFALHKLHNALRLGCDSVGANNISDMRDLLKNMYTSFSEYYSAVFKVKEHIKQVSDERNRHAGRID